MTADQPGRLDLGPWVPADTAAQDVLATASRRAQPRAWLRAVQWLVGAGLHRACGPTTLAVARDLAARMDYQRGIVLYDLQGTAGRVGVSRATVKRHVAYLRELGALVWLVHGSKRNLRLPGRPYTATATVYGAVIPPGYDRAMGHRLSGTGYQARVVGFTAAGRARALPTASSEPSRPDPDEANEPHSLGSSPIPEKAEVGGGLKDTRRSSPNQRRPSTPQPGSAGGTARTALQVAQDIAVARRVRAMVQWTQHEQLRRLAYALRPLIDQGLGADDIAAELHSWYLTWRPARPAAYIASHLAARTGREDQVPAVEAVAPMQNEAWRSLCGQRAAAVGSLALLFRQPVRTDAQRAEARAHGRHDIGLVVEYLHTHGADDALDLYGTALTSLAVRIEASPFMAFR